MSIYVNIRFDNDKVVESVVHNEAQFNHLMNDTLRNDKGKVYLVLTAVKNTRDIPYELFVTPNITDIEIFFEELLIHDHLYIQVFDQYDYKSMVRFLNLLYLESPMLSNLLPYSLN